MLIVKDWQRKVENNSVILLKFLIKITDIYFSGFRNGCLRIKVMEDK